jgi:hypothetical protein
MLTAFQKVMTEAVAIAVDSAVNRVISAITPAIEASSSVSASVQTQALISKYDNDKLEQYSRRESLRFIGIPEEVGENLKAKIQEIAQVTDVDVKEEEIAVVHRSGQSYNGKPRQVLCKFYSREKREKIYSGRKKLKENPIHKGKTFINEDLTPLRSKLLGYIKSIDGIRSVSTKNGRIFCNTSDNKLVIVDTPDDLFELGVNTVDYHRLGLGKYLSPTTVQGQAHSITRSQHHK